MKKIIPISIGFLLMSCCYAQQAIINGSFESSTNPVHYQQVHYGPGPNPHWNATTFASNWTSPTGGSPDLFSNAGTSACGLVNDPSDNPSGTSCYPQVCPEENIWGYQSPRTGSNMVGFSSYPAGVPEYIQTQFNTTLAAGQCYHLSFWVSRSDLSQKHLRLQAVVSSTHMRDLTSVGVLDYSVDQDAIVLTDPHFKSNKQYWELVEFDFKALGGEKYLTIGIFDYNGTPNAQNPALLDPVCQAESNMPGSCGTLASSNPCSNCSQVMAGGYYYVDDVSLTPVAGGGFTPSANCTFTNANPNLSGTYTNQNILISGQVVINANTTFSGCTVKCNAGSTITVPSGKTFTILNSMLSAGCDNMWDGIIVHGRIEVEGSHIQDALCALYMQATTASWALQRNIASGNSNFFERNLLDIKVNQNSTSTTNVIKSSIFDHHNAPLNDPSLSSDGYGKIGILFVGPGSSIPETVGGTSVNDFCYFYGGENGIVSTNYTLDVNHCYFEFQTKDAISFQGLSGYHRKLTVLNSTFKAAKNHIFAMHNTNLTVQASSFSDASEHSIVWIDNRDGKLFIGDPNDEALGNTFQSNQWACIAAFANKTTQTNHAALAANSNHAFTEITIANNTMNCLPYTHGIIVSESALGNNVSYHSMEIVNNTINNAWYGIQIYNVKGWGGVNVSSPPVMQVSDNMIFPSTMLAADAVGIKAHNDAGLIFEGNGIVCPNWGNYVNRGMYFQNVDHTEIYGNIIYAGTCISAEFYMLQSNLYCNWLLQYSVGFGLAYTYLRPSPSDPHGIPGTMQYVNTVPYTSVNWNSDIYNYNSDVYNNKWVWNNAATNLTITNSGNTGSGSIISTYTGADRCESFMGMTTYSPVTETVDLTISGDAPMQWRADYIYETYRRTNGATDTTVASANIKKILDAENFINLGEYTTALTVLTAVTPVNNVEENYVDVLTIFATINSEDRDPTAAEKNDLIAVAEKHSRVDGAAVTLARAYLAIQYNLYFADERMAESEEIHGATNLSAPCSLEPNSDTWLSFIDENGNDLAIEGTYINADGTFIFDPLEVAYHRNLNPSTEYRIFSKPGSKYSVVSFEYHTLADWLVASPISLDLAGVSTETDTITVEQYVDLEHHTSVMTPNEIEYSVGSVETATGSDFLIEKRNGYDLVWSRTWHGPVTEGVDEATCLYVDANENVYVAGKVYNGDDYDVQILKYDTEGNLIWSSVFIDEGRLDDEPDAIYFDETEQCVKVEGACESQYRYIKVVQCLPGAARMGHSSDSTTALVELQPMFYPSPSEGILSIDLNGGSGGLFELFNVEGQVVYTEQISQNRTIQLPPTVTDGVYLVKFSGEGEPYYQKLVIQHND